MERGEWRGSKMEIKGKRYKERECMVVRKL